MRLVVFSHKVCWASESSPTGYATDGGFSFQMQALSELFDATTLVVPCRVVRDTEGETALEGRAMSVVPLAEPPGTGALRKLLLPLWVMRNSRILLREVRQAGAVHAPIPGDIGTVGMLLALALRKPLFVRHCGNWFRPKTTAESLWKWTMERLAGGDRVMLATGGAVEPPSRRNIAIQWIFSSSMRQSEITSCYRIRERPSSSSLRLIIVCRQEVEKGTGLVIQSLPTIVQRFPLATLDVVGDGSALGLFRRMTADLQLADRVIFHRRVDHARVIELLKGAHLFCYPTAASEGFPKVVLEAMACGLPVVATRVSVLPQLIRRGCGRIVEQASPKAIADAVTEIVTNEDRYLQMSASAVETAQEYSLERWRDTIASMLRPVWGPMCSDDRSF
jgi:Glycosyl transferases group 1